ncbi:MAG: ArsR/SmtB family transcription factor [Candidatus Helarchaeota archaeon]
MIEPNQIEMERLKRYLNDNNLVSEEKVNEYIIDVRNKLNEYPIDKIKNQMEVFKAFGKINRIKILLLLLNLKKICACELIIFLELSQSNVSHHLRILERAGLITNYSRGKWKFHYLTEKGEKLIKLFLELMEN